MIVVARCGKNEKELRLWNGLGELRRQMSPTIGARRLLPMPTRVPRPSMGRTLRRLFRHQPLRIETGQRVAFEGFLPDQIRWCDAAPYLGDLSAAEFTCEAATPEEFVERAGQRLREAIATDRPPNLISPIVKNVHASPQPAERSLHVQIIAMPFQELGKQGLGV